MSEQRGTGRAYTLLGLLAGAAVGAAIGLVYSPHSGQKNRRQLVQWAHNRLGKVHGRAKVSG